jgi:2-desacetyl-2-hydroxyethyl bacteriochlorophyllide A dehydrogenase
LVEKEGFMQAVQISAPHLVELVTQIIPKPKQGEALLRILYGGICGSDLGSYRGTFAYVSYPRIPGHEFSAEIVEIGPNEYGLTTGMVVTANPYFNCGHCYACRHGLVNACMENQTMGVQRDGAFSQYITMPINRLYQGNGLSPTTLAMVEPFCIAHHGVRKANVKAGETVLVMGSGTIGMLCAFTLRALKANVWIADIDPVKLQFAQSLGFNQTLLNDDADHFKEQVQHVTNHNGFDVVVEAVGVASTFLACIESAAFGGRVIQIGVGKQEALFNFTQIQKKELLIHGSRNALDEDFRSVLAMLGQNNFPIEGLISRIYPFLEAPKAFEYFSQGTGVRMKILLDFTKENPNE